jgi:hypothetical protein
MDSLSSSLGFDHQTTRFRLSAHGRVSASLFRGVSELDDLGYGGGVSGFYVLSPRTVWTFGQDASAGRFDQDLLFSEGVQLIAPQVRTSVSLSRTGLSVQLSPRTSLALEAGYDWLSFDSPELIDGAQFLLGPATGNRGVTSPTGPVNPISGGQLVVPDSQRFALSALGAQGLRVPQVTEQFGFGAVTLQHQVTSLTELFTSVRYGYRFFVTPGVVVEDDSLVDGADIEGLVMVRRRLGAYDGISLSYGVRRIDSQVPNIASHDVALGWDRNVSRPGFVLAFDASGGINYFRAVGDATPSLTDAPVPSVAFSTSGEFAPTANLGLALVLRERTSIEARYNRQPTGTVGFGRNFSIHDISAGVTHNFGTRWVADVRWEWLDSKELLNTDSFTFNANRLSATGQFNITSNVGVGGGYSHNRLTALDDLTGIDREDVWHFYVMYSAGAQQDQLGVR